MCIKVISLFVLLVVALSQFTANAGKIVVYWGQGSGQDEGTLTETCKSGLYEYVIIAFLSTFGNGQKPLINLDGHCEDPSIGCHKVSNGIRFCQSMNIKVLLSIGGGGDPKQYSLISRNDAIEVADYLWNNFLGGQSENRPLGDAELDGIDFDIEAQSGYYATLARRLSDHIQRSGKKKYLTAAPQCKFPDVNLNPALKTGLFDYIWIQFYNNPECEFDITNPYKFKNAWIKWTSNIQAKKFFVGLPASPSVDRNGFINSKTLVKEVIPFVKTLGEKYGGVMLWDRKHDHGYSSRIKANV